MTGCCCFNPLAYSKHNHFHNYQYDSTTKMRKVNL